MTKTEPMPLVIVESPYAGEIEKNVAYARLCIRDCIRRGEAPFASHLLYTQPLTLRDEVPEERTLGIEVGLQWGRAASLVAVYTELGISAGMELGINRHLEEGRNVEYRTLLPEQLFLYRMSREVRMAELCKASSGRREHLKNAELQRQFAEHEAEKWDNR